jgi:hypothetical protein
LNLVNAGHVALCRESSGLHPREAVAALAESVLDATGQALGDDASVLCLDWYGGHGRARRTEQGADVDGASGPRSA